MNQEYVEICVPDSRIIEYVTLKTVSLQYPGFAEKLDIVKLTSQNFSVFMKVFLEWRQILFSHKWNQRYIYFDVIDIESTNIVAQWDNGKIIIYTNNKYIKSYNRGVTVTMTIDYDCPLNNDEVELVSANYNRIVKIKTDEIKDGKRVLTFENAPDYTLGGPN